MSLFSRPVIFIPGSGQWNPESPHHVSERRPRRNIRCPAYPAAMRRHALDYAPTRDPYQYLILDDYPEDGLYDVPVRYVGIKPSQLPGTGVRTKPDQFQRGEDDGKKGKDYSQTPSAHDSVYETERSDESEEETTPKDAGPVVMDLDQFVGQIFNNIYGLKSEIWDRKMAKKMAQEEGLRKSKEAIRPKSLSDKKPAASETKSKTNREAKGRKEDKTPARIQEIDIYHERDDVADGKELANPEFGQVEAEAETQSRSGVLMTPDRSNPKERQVNEVREETGQFQVTYDLSFFHPEEIQVKLTEGKLIMDAVHEVVQRGLFEKQTMHREIVLPPGIDTDSLRCRLAEDGHMMISADYLEKSKQVRVLPIEVNY